MSLKSIVARLGGDLYDHGRRANVPAPGHSRHDRSISLLQDGERIIVHSFGAADWREVRDQLRDLGLLSVELGGDAARTAWSSNRPASEATRRAAARRIWDDGRPLDGTLSARHCRLRGVDGDLPGSHALRHGAQTPRSAYRDLGPRRPALLAGLLDPAGELAAVEITYLAPNGRRSERMRLPRKLVGVAPPGSAVRLAPPAPSMLVAEGVFTTLSASRRFALPGWALTSAGNLRRWRAPAGVARVLIAADRGEAGEAAAETLRRALATDGVEAEVVLPPGGFGDWNEAAAAEAKGERKGWAGRV